MRTPCSRVVWKLPRSRRFQIRSETFRGGGTGLRSCPECVRAASRPCRKSWMRAYGLHGPFEGAIARGPRGLDVVRQHAKTWRGQQPAQGFEIVFGAFHRRLHAVADPAEQLATV